jgi:hypothetical protein
MAVYSPWAAMFILECIGARIYSKRSKLMAVYFATAVMLDAGAFAIFQNCGIDFYAWSAWAAKGIRGLMLIWLACSICGMFVAERRKSFATISAAFLSLASGALITVFSANGETLKDKLLDGEIAANMILLAIVFIGWIGRRDRLEQTWKWIALGFMVMVGSDLVFTILWTFWEGARHWYPMGAIAAYLIWVAGPLRRVKLPEFRQSLQHKFGEIEKVRIM